MKICLIQTDPSRRRGNIQSLGWAMRQIEADLYVLPELFTTGFDYLAVPQHWPTDAEVFPMGITSCQILGFVKDRPAAVICGLLEQYGKDFYNVAAVIGSGTIERYRQKYPASTVNGRVLPIQAGDYQKITVALPEPVLWSIGFMICHDHYRTAEFFEEYKKRGVNAVVLIADSSTRAWLKEFPLYCREYALTGIVCNAAGPNGGGSCVINSAGEFVPLLAAHANYPSFLPDTPMAALAAL